MLATVGIAQAFHPLSGKYYLKASPIGIPKTHSSMGIYLKVIFFKYLQMFGRFYMDIDSKLFNIAYRGLYW